MSLQAFKDNDPIEAKVTEVFTSALDPLEEDRDTFFEDAFINYNLGDVIFSLKNGPLSEALPLNVFRQSFFELYNFFTMPGTFEFYLDLCRIIWGEDVEVEFTVPDNGVLLINIAGLSFEQTFFQAREIVDDTYVYSFMTTQDGDFIMFQTTRGLKTQQEVDTLFKELSVAGVYTVPTLSLE